MTNPRATWQEGRWSEPAVIILSRIAQVIGMLVSSRVATALLPPEQMAGVVQITSVAGAFNLLLLTPVWHYMARGFIDWRAAGTLDRCARRFLDYVVLVAAGAALLTWAFSLRVELVSGFSPSWTAGLVALYLVSSAISTLGTSGFNLLGHRIPFALFSNAPIWSGLAFSVLAYRWRPEPSSWALGQFSGLAVGCLSYLLLRARMHGDRDAGEATAAMPPFTVRSVAWFAWPTVVTAGLWWIQSQSYRFVLDRVAGPASVGLFAVGYALAASPIALYESAFGQFYEPIYYRALKGSSSTGQTAAWNAYARAYLPGLVTVVVFIAAGGSFMARVLVGERFREAAGILVVWGALSEGMRASGGMVYSLGVAKLDTRLAVLPVAAGALVAPLGVHFLARLDPLNGAALGLLAAAAASLLLGIRSTSVALPITWPFRRMLLALVLSAPLAAGFLMLRHLDATPSTLEALLALALGGAYVLFVQVWLLRATLVPAVAHESYS